MGVVAVAISQARLAELTKLIASGSEAKFYDWTEWEQIRASVLALDHYECQQCKMKGKYGKAVLVHHVKHLKDRPDLALSVWDENDRQLVSLCRGCHEDEHPERRWRKVVHREYITQERWD